MGGAGIVLAMIGVIACPITSGDTSFRAARLVIADWFKLDQDSYKVRLAVTLPLLTAGALISQLNYDVVWRYFSWSNQTLAMIALWTIAMISIKITGFTGWRRFLRRLCPLFQSHTSVSQRSVSAFPLRFPIRSALWPH